ncbi:MAG: hypothetical protein M0Z82_03775 [Actinomycetota bacterium]|nr:hypothetical protein [Actinomycetota bacterium]
MAVDRRIDQLLASPLGRQFALHLVDPMAELTLDGLSRDEAKRAVSSAVLAWVSLPEGPDALLAALARDTFDFGFSGEDEGLWPLSQAAREELRPVADALVAAAGPLGWWEPVDRADQRLLVWDDLPEIGEGGIDGLVHETVARERAMSEEGLRRPRPRPRPGVRIGATWWSAPGFAPLTWTTRAVPPLPTTALLGFIDTHQPFEATGARIFSLAIDPSARVYEITEPEDWRRLVQRFPEDATGTHDGEWRDWGGVTGPWLLPNWEGVMAHYDAVHVTVGGYVASCGLALPVGDAYTMLAGWIPDATLWLHDVAVARRFLGRWRGQPTPELNEIMAAWEPA